MPRRDGGAAGELELANVAPLAPGAQQIADAWTLGGGGHVPNLARRRPRGHYLGGNRHAAASVPCWASPHERLQRSTDMTPPNLTAASKTVKPVWSVEMFEQFWANPDPALVPPDIFAAAVVADWPGLAEPVRGVADYAQRLTDLMAILPDMRLE